MESGKIVNNSFEVLSKEGRDFVLNGRMVDKKRCDIDMKYWFGN
ncbi:hypothetical protein [Pedobacter lusitanus]|nr:hypothetical protein [Pedobacter lusitanus]